MNWCKFFGMILNNWQAVVSVWHWEWGLGCSHSQSSLGQHSATSPGHWQLLSHRRLNDKCSCWFILQCLIKLDLFLVYRNNEILNIHFDWSFRKGFPTLKEKLLKLHFSGQSFGWWWICQGVFSRRSNPGILSNMVI